MRNLRLLRSIAYALALFLFIISALCPPFSHGKFLPGRVIAAVQDWFVGQEVEVYWKGQWYTATILAKEGGKYRVHYKGYGNEWDEWIGHKRLRATVNNANSANQAQPNPATVVPQSEPLGSFSKGYVEHNVYENGIKGMRLHFWFRISNAYDLSCRAVAYFNYKNGVKLKARSSKYSTTDGQVSVEAPFTPKFDPVDYNDFQLFMPYDELNMSPGYSELKFQVKLYDNYRKKFFATSNYYDFNLTK